MTLALTGIGIATQRSVAIGAVALLQRGPVRVTPAGPSRATDRASRSRAADGHRHRGRAAAARDPGAASRRPRRPDIAEFIDAHIMMLGDRTLFGAVEELIRETAAARSGPSQSAPGHPGAGLRRHGGPLPANAARRPGPRRHAGAEDPAAAGRRRPARPSRQGHRRRRPDAGGHAADARAGRRRLRHRVRRPDVAHGDPRPQPRHPRRRRRAARRPSTCARARPSCSTAPPAWCSPVATPTCWRASGSAWRPSATGRRR